MPNRKHNRLKGYDYSNPGGYFLTICTKKRFNLFGDVVNSEMILNNYGNIAHKMWSGLTKVFRNIVLDQFIIMPNHVHGIIIITDNAQVGNASKLFVKVPGKDALLTDNSNFEINAEMHSLQEEKEIDRTKMLISNIVKEYKSEVTRRFKNIYQPKMSGSVWQRSFYDRIIRNEAELSNIQRYIFYNPLSWQNDIENSKISNKHVREKYYDDIIQNK